MRIAWAEDLFQGAIKFVLQDSRNSKTPEAQRKYHKSLP